MIKINYDPDFGIKRNIQNAQDILGLRLEEVANEAGMSLASVRGRISGNFRSTAGSESKPGARVKRILDRYFIGGIPELGKIESVDLFNIFKCDECRYKMRSQRGCYKFGYTREEINRGAYIHLVDGERFFLSKKTPCPYVGGTR